MKVLGIIPARYKSTRFPGKPLVQILGKPMIIHVAERVEQALGKENFCVATDDDRIEKVVTDFGYRVTRTTEKPKTGTDRLWEVAQIEAADIYVNIQGDEPMINPADILKIIEIKKQTMEKVTNGMCPLGAGEDPWDVKIPKVVVSKNNDLIYMSRLAVPGSKDPDRPDKPVYLKQVCIYAFTYDQLKAFGSSEEKASYENFEDIEILRFFDYNIGIRMVETTGASLAVDIPEDVAAVEQALQSIRANAG